MRKKRIRDHVFGAFRLGSERMHLRRNLKDRLFRYIFEKDKQALLELYNALNQTEYTNPDELQIVTIENVICMSMKNDLAFAIAGTLNLYEQQSTINPNMPIRFFIYIAEEFQQIIAKQGIEKLYGTKLIKLPVPKCVVFYSGNKKAPEQDILRLSDAFEEGKEKPDVELLVHFLNINAGYNEDIMGKCRRLREYSLFVEQITAGLTEGLTRRQAVYQAIDYCVDHDILADILQNSRMEVAGMILSEFNEKKFLTLMREEGKEEGIKEGIKEGGMLKLCLQVRRKYDKGKKVEVIAEELEEEVGTIEGICQVLREYPGVSDDELYMKWAKKQ